VLFQETPPDRQVLVELEAVYQVAKAVPYQYLEYLGEPAESPWGPGYVSQLQDDLLCLGIRGQGLENTEFRIKNTEYLLLFLNSDY